MFISGPEQKSLENDKKKEYGTTEEPKILQKSSIFMHRKVPQYL
jgi:hypothetical protein